MILTGSILLLAIIGAVNPFPFNFNGQIPTYGFHQPLMVANAPPLHAQFYKNIQDTILPLNSNAQRTYSHHQQQLQQLNQQQPPFHLQQIQQQPLSLPLQQNQRYNSQPSNLNQQQHQRPLNAIPKAPQQFYGPTLPDQPQQGRFNHPLNNQRVPKANAASGSNDFLANLQIIDTNGKLRQLKEFGLGGHGSQPFEPELERHLRTIFDTINRDLEHADFLPLDVRGADQHLNKLFQQQYPTGSSPPPRPITQQLQPIPPPPPPPPSQQQSKTIGATQQPQQALGYSFTQKQQHQFQYLKPKRANDVVPKSDVPVRSPAQNAREPKQIEKAVPEQRPIEQTRIQQEQFTLKVPQEQTQTTQQFDDKLITTLPTKAPVRQEYREPEPKGRKVDTAFVQQKETIDQFQAPIDEQQQQQQFIQPEPVEQRPSQAPIPNDQQQLGFDDEPAPLKTVERKVSPKLHSITQPRNEEQALKSNQQIEQLPVKGPQNEAPIIPQQREQTEQYQSKKLDGWTPIVQRDRPLPAVKGRKSSTKSGEQKKGPLIRPTQRVSEPQQQGYLLKPVQRQVSNKFSAPAREQIQQRQVEAPFSQQQQVQQDDVVQQQREAPVYPSRVQQVEPFPIQQQQEAPVFQQQQREEPVFPQQQRDEQAPLQQQHEEPTFIQQQKQEIPQQQQVNQEQIYQQRKVQQQRREEPLPIAQQRQEEPIQQKNEEIFDQRQDDQGQIQQNRQEVSSLTQQEEPFRQLHEDLVQQLQQQEEQTQQRQEEPTQQTQEQQQQVQEDIFTTPPATTTTTTTTTTTARPKSAFKSRPIEQQSENKVRSPIKNRPQPSVKVNAPVQWAAEEPVEQERQTPQQQEVTSLGQQQQQREDNTPVQVIGQEEQQFSTTVRSDQVDSDQVTTQPTEQTTDTQAQKGRQQQQLAIPQQQEEQSRQQVQQEDEALTAVTTERSEQQLDGFKTEQQDEKGANLKQTVPNQQDKAVQRDEQTEQVQFDKQQEEEPSTTTTTTSTTTTPRPEPIKGKQQSNIKSRPSPQRARSQPPRGPSREIPTEQQQTQNQQEEVEQQTITTTTARPRFVSKGRKGKQGNVFKSRPQVSNEPSFGYSSQQNVNTFNNEGSLSAQQLLNTYNPLQFEPERISSLKTQQGSSQNSNVNSSSSEDSY